MSPVRSAVLAAVALLTLAPSAHAQAQVEFTLFGGAAIFAGDLSDPFTLGGSSFEAQTMNNSIAVGFDAAVRVSQFAIEGRLALIPATMVTPSDLDVDGVEVAVFNDQSILLLGANALFFPPQSNPLLEFFLTAGVGAKRYSTADPFGGWDAGEMDLAFNGGGGLYVRVAPTVSVRVDARDYVSSFNAFANFDSEGAARLQHDVLVTAGVSFRTR